MLKNEREREIISILKSCGGFVTVRDLCTQLYASESSIRRDLTALENKGIVKKTYGGAELVTNYSNVIAFNRRTHHNVYAKKLIAKKAVTLIKEGSIVFLDQSSTALYLAHEIINRSGITVVTNNIEIVSLLTGTAIKTICSGGTLSADNRICLIGADAQYIFEHTYADIVFFSAKSMSEEGLISDCTREEVIVRNSMIANAAKKVFLCDSEKFDTCSAYKQCDISKIDYLVSENETAKKYQKLNNSLVIL